MAELNELRREMVDRQLVARGMRDPDVLRAMGEVPREVFVPKHLQHLAYSDSPLPIGEEQTISQPYIVALMTEAMEVSTEDRVLEIGTGSGYAAAVLSRIAAAVYTVERYASLARAAQRRFEELGYDNVHVRHGDGTLGWAAHAPYDAIVVTAGGPQVPGPLLEQLAIGGCLIIPVGPSHYSQELVRIRRTSETNYRRENLGAVRFVPLVGSEGWRG